MPTTATGSLSFSFTPHKIDGDYWCQDISSFRLDVQGHSPVYLRNVRLVSVGGGNQGTFLARLYAVTHNFYSSDYIDKISSSVYSIKATGGGGNPGSTYIIGTGNPNWWNGQLQNQVSYELYYVLCVEADGTITVRRFLQTSNADGASYYSNTETVCVLSSGNNRLHVTGWVPQNTEGTDSRYTYNYFPSGYFGWLRPHVMGFYEVGSGVGSDYIDTDSNGDHFKVRVRFPGTPINPCLEWDDKTTSNNTAIAMSKVSEASASHYGVYEADVQTPTSSVADVTLPHVCRAVCTGYTDDDEADRSTQSDCYNFVPILETGSPKPTFYSGEADGTSHRLLTLSTPVYLRDSVGSILDTNNDPIPLNVLTHEYDTAESIQWLAKNGISLPYSPANITVDEPGTYERWCICDGYVCNSNNNDAGYINYLDASFYAKGTSRVTGGDQIPGLSLKLGSTTITNSSTQITYDGAAHRPAVSGIESGDTVAWSFSDGTATTTSLAAPQFTDVGTYVITATVSRSGYADTELTGTLEIQPKQLTIPNLAASNKTYNNSNVAALKINGTDITTGTDVFSYVSGIVSGDEVEVYIDSATFQDKHAGENKPVSIVCSIDGADAGNYLTPVISGVTATIAARRIYIDSAPVFASKTYDKTTALPTVVTKPTTHNWVSTDGTTYLEAVVSGTTVLANANVGTKSTVLHYEIAYRAGYSESNSPTYISDYYISNSDTSTVDIQVNPKPLDITDTTQISKTYNKSAALTGLSITNARIAGGVIAGDTVSIASAAATFPSSNVGTYDNVVVTYTLGGASAGNYTATRTASGTITPFQLTATGTPTVITKLEDGTDTATLDLTGVSINTFGADEVSLNATGQFASAYPGEQDVTITYTLGGSAKDNYLAPASTTVRGTIEAVVVVHDYWIKKVYNGSETTADTFVYNGNGNGVAFSLMDGNTQVTAQDATIRWWVERWWGDTLIVNYTQNGESDYVDFYGDFYVAALVENESHEYVKVAETSFALTQKPLSISGSPTISNKVYDGKLNTTATVGATSGVFAGERATVAAQAKFRDKNVGTNKIVDIHYYVAGDDGENYAPPADTTGTASITAKSLSCTGTTGDDKYYDGKTDAQVHMGTVTGIIAGDDVSVTAAGQFNSAAASTTGNFGNKTITVTYTITGDDARNYTAPAQEVLQDHTIFPTTIRCSWIAVSYT